MRARIAAAVDVISSLIFVAWVGGQAALGAFGARIAFQELPREEAARTMTRVFHEFDRLILAGVVLLAIAAVVAYVARSSASSIRLGLELGLCALGLFEVFYVHAHIEAMFHAGQTLAPAFQAMHHLSERCAHGEALLVLACFSERAFGSRA